MHVGVVISGAFQLRLSDGYDGFVGYAYFEDCIQATLTNFLGPARFFHFVEAGHWR